MLKYTITALMYIIVSISVAQAEVKGVFKIAAKETGIPAELLSAVCKVESGHRNLIVMDNGSASIGMCMIKFQTARHMGFKGHISDLLNPMTNARYSARYLSYQLKRYKSYKKAIIAYNRGHYNAKKHTFNDCYLTKVVLSLRGDNL